MSDYKDLSLKQILNRFIVNVGLFSSGAILIRLGQFFLLPLYWKVLTPEDFGVLAIVQSLNLILFAPLNLCLNDAILRNYAEWSLEQRNKNIGAIYLFSILISASIISFLLITGSFWTPFLFKSIPYYPYVPLSLIIVFFLNHNLIPLSIFRIQEKTKTYSIFSFLMFATQTIAIISMLFIFKKGLVGYLWGQIIGLTIWSIIYLFYIVKDCPFNWNFTLIKESLKFTGPLTVSALFEGLLMSLDRYFLDKYSTLTMSGIYYIANQFGQALNAFNQLFKFSWMPLIFNIHISRDDSKKIIPVMSTVYFFIISIPTVALISFDSDILNLLGNQSYFSASTIIPFYVITYFLFSIAGIFGRGIDLTKKTIYSPILPILGIIVSVSLSKYLITKYEMLGAAILFLTGVSVRVFVQIYIAGRLSKIDYQLKFVSIIASTGIITTLITERIILQPFALQVFVKLLIFIGFVFLNFKFLRKNLKGFNAAV